MRSVSDALDVLLAQPESQANEPGSAEPADPESSDPLANRVSFRVNDQQYNYLERLQDSADLRISDLVRQALDDFLEETPIDETPRSALIALAKLLRDIHVRQRACILALDQDSTSSSQTTTEG